MSRAVRRVPLDFDFPRGDTWPGYLTPDELHEAQCVHCGGGGYSDFARHQHSRWYGYVPFDPAETGSPRLTPNTPAVRAFAERNVASSPLFYRRGERAIAEEAARLAALWNGMWSHHLSQVDVDALVEGGRLYDFTHTWIKGRGWEPILPTPTVTAEQVNTWSLRGFGHDSINSSVVIRAKCERENQPLVCAHCEGHGSAEAYPGQRADAEAWQPTAPPTGDGYQLWQTVSEGGPVSPVFVTPEELADWIRTEGSKFDGSTTPRDALIRWINNDGHSAGSFVIADGVMKSGVEFAAGAS